MADHSALGEHSYEDARKRPPAHFSGRKQSDSAQTSCSSGESTRTRSSAKPPLHDVLTVLQAAPLVWRHEQKEDLRPVEMLDFDKEREILADSLRDAEKLGAHIDLVSETATTEALVRLLEPNRFEALHFSCHGYYSGLCFEDGEGGTHFLDASSLRELATTAGGSLRFVFVSACFSRAAGEAFVSAGVKHVVCCHQDEQLMDEATILFSANFYRALACGKDLQTAFERGQLAVRNSPSISDPEIEMNKFLLLPEDADHRVAVFYTHAARHRSDELPVLLADAETIAASAIIPHPPDHFFGREVDIYNVLQSLIRFRLVKITGPNGIGKGSLAAAVCHYIKARRRCFHYERIIWCPLLNTSNDCELMSSFHRIFDLIHNETLEVTLQEDCEFRNICGVIVERLYQKSVLLAIDSRRFIGELPVKKLSLFLEHLIRATRKVKVILVCSDVTQRWWQSPCLEAEHEVSTLNFKASALLFGSASPFVAARRHNKARTPQRLSSLLVAEKDEFCHINDSNLSKRCSRIFALIGGGNPARSLEAARTMTTHEYDDLIHLGEKEDFSPQCATHVELECKLMEIEREIEAALANEDFEAAAAMHESRDEMTMLLESLPSATELKGQEASLGREIKKALSRNDYKMAHQLKQSLQDIKDKINMEESACGDMKPAAEPSFATRVEADVHAAKLEADFQSAMVQGDCMKAKTLRCELKRAEASRACLPSHAELADELQSLEKTFEGSLRERNVETADVLSQLIKEVKLQISQERSARIRLQPELARYSPGAVSVARSRPEVSQKAANAESTNSRTEPHNSWKSYGWQQNDVRAAAPGASTGTSSGVGALGEGEEPRAGGEGVDGHQTTELAAPGTISVTPTRRQTDGVDSSSEQRVPGEGEEPRAGVEGVGGHQTIELAATGAISVTPTRRQTDGVNYSSEQRVPGEGEEPRAGAEGVGGHQATELAATGAIPATPTRRQRDGVPEVADDAENANEEIVEHTDDVGDGETVLSALPVLPVAVRVEPARGDATANDFGARIASDGHLITEEEIKRLRTNNGWCPTCGVTRTHSKNLLRGLSPLNNDEVRHGVCLQCHPVADEQGDREKSLKIVRHRMNKGLCPSCGNKTHKVSIFGRNKKPLTVEGKSANGVCLLCHPDEVVRMDNIGTEAWLHCSRV